METLLPDIDATFVAARPIFVEQERYERRKLKKADDNRWRRLVELAHQQREAEIAHDFLKTLKEMDFDPDHQIAGHLVSNWIAWAEDRLEHATPLRQGVNSIFEVLAGITAWS